MFVYKLLPAVSVNLHWDAKFTKPFGEDGFHHSFGLFVLHSHDHGVFREHVGDAQDVLVLTAG